MTSCPLDDTQPPELGGSQEERVARRVAELFDSYAQFRTSAPVPEIIEVACTRTFDSQLAALGPGIRVIELHILGIQVQLRSVKIGRHRRWPRANFSWSPANATHWRAKKTSTVERDKGFVNHCERTVLIKQHQRLLATSMVTRWK